MQMPDIDDRPFWAVGFGVVSENVSEQGCCNSLRLGVAIISEVDQHFRSLA